MTTLHRKIRKMTEKAILEYGMIRDGDKLLIGVSGGPDSLSMLKIFHDGLVVTKVDFSWIVVNVDLGFPQSSPNNGEQLEDHFKSLNVPYEIVKTDISTHALDPNAKKNPCFICAMYRRRQIYEAATRLGCNKIAYAHHKDDIVETLLINILYGRKIGSMNPVQEIFQGSRHIIRPLMYVDEWMLKKFAEESGLPQLPRLCPADGNTRRQTVKELIARLQQSEKHANIKENIFNAHRHVDIRFPPDQCSLS